MIFHHNLHFNEQHITSLGLDIHGCGHISTNGKQITPRPRTLDCFSICYLEAGTGYLETGSLPRCNLVAGDVFILYPGERHTFGPSPEDDWREYWMMFDGTTARHFLDNGFLVPRHPLYHLGADTAIRSLFEEAMEAAREYTARAALPAHLFRLLSYIMKKRKQYNHENTALYAIKTQIEAAPHLKWDFPQAAADHSMSYSLFRKNFALEFGLSPQRYLINERMLKAKSLLAQDTPVHAAAAAVGMDDPYYFSRLFKKVTGVSPRQFKNALRSWKKN